MLIIVCGLPGTGKSSLSRRLKLRLPAVHLNSDKIRKQIFPKPEYTEEEKRRVYSEMANQAEKLLKEGKNVIVDATFYSVKYRKMMKETAGDAGTKCHVIRCILPEEHVKSRLERREERGKSLSDADYEVYLSLRDRFEPIEGPHLEIDCSLPAREQVRMAKEFMGVRNGR